MADLFLKFVNTGISAGWLVLAIVLFRWLFPKMPKWLRPVFWGLVGLRLVLFTSVKSVLSLIPSAQTVAPEIMQMEEPAIHSGLMMLNTIVNPLITETFAPKPGDSANPLQVLIPVLAVIWLVGIALMAAGAGMSCLRLRYRLRTAVRLRENIYQSEQVVSPFVFGLLRPRIYLPFGMEEGLMKNVILHEQMHIARRDHLGKIFGYLLLCLYWFCPLCWVAYLLFCRDIELACDERVIRAFGREERADYSQALLRLSSPRFGVHACPLAFGEVGVKARVRNVLNYKKPMFWAVAVAVIMCIVMAVCFLTDPKQGAGMGNVVYNGKGVVCWYDAGPDTGAMDAKWLAKRNTVGGGGCWFDFWADTDTLPEDFWGGGWEVELPEFSGVTFVATAAGMEAVTKEGRTGLIAGMPVWNMYLTDLNGDGLPEFCATVSYGSGIVDEHIVVYDYANGESYTLWERGVYDYVLKMEDGKLLVRRTVYPDTGNPEGAVTGTLWLVAGEDGERHLEMVSLPE